MGKPCVSWGSPTDYWVSLPWHAVPVMEHDNQRYRLSRNTAGALAEAVKLWLRMSRVRRAHT